MLGKEEGVESILILNNEALALFNLEDFFPFESGSYFESVALAGLEPPCLVEPLSFKLYKKRVIISSMYVSFILVPSHGHHL